MVESEGKDGEGGSETNVLPEAELQGRCKDALCAECPPGGLGRPQPMVRPAVEGCSLHPHRSPTPNNHIEQLVFIERVYVKHCTSSNSLKVATTLCHRHYLYNVPDEET